MELWVRSQDKENLSKAEHLGVYNEKIYVNGYEDNGYCIGIYDTPERALEVLDEIQNFISETDIEGNRYYQYQVYEMPEE